MTAEDIASMAVTEDNLRQLRLNKHDPTAMLSGQMDQEHSHGDPRAQTNPD